MASWPRALDLRGDVGAARAVHLRHHDAGAPRREMQRQRLADPLPGAGDDADFSLHACKLPNGRRYFGAHWPMVATNVLSQYLSFDHGALMWPDAMAMSKNAFMPPSEARRPSSRQPPTRLR